MDLDILLRRNQHSLMAVDRSMTPRDRRAHEQFARDYAEHTNIIRGALGARPTQKGFIT